ncbi:hypothetical protein HD554DRAFT_2176097 [Boletus coccyginus]|nr:hypothetical protein HD554DRAFT_2176097 [Boletus coccyginus]
MHTPSLVIILARPLVSRAFAQDRTTEQGEAKSPIRVRRAIQDGVWLFLPPCRAHDACLPGVPESYVVGGQTVRPYELALSILLPIGEYFQIQDDFLDHAEQRAVLDANYGRKDAEREARVKEVFDAVGLRERYRVYEEGIKEKLDVLIAGVPEPEGDVDVDGVLRRRVFTAFLDEIYKRTR